MNLAETAYDMPTGMLLHEAGRQFAMAEIVRDGRQQCLYQRGGWFLLLVWAARTCGVPAYVRTDPSQPWTPEHCRNYPTEAAALLNARGVTEGGDGR